MDTAQLIKSHFLVITWVSVIHLHKATSVDAIVISYAIQTVNVLYDVSLM